MNKLHWLITLALVGMFFWPATTENLLTKGAEWTGRILDAAIATSQKETEK